MNENENKNKNYYFSVEIEKHKEITIRSVLGIFDDILDAQELLMKSVEKGIWYAVICSDGRCWYYRFSDTKGVASKLSTGEKIIMLEDDYIPALEGYGYSSYILDRISNIEVLFDKIP